MGVRVGQTIGLDGAMMTFIETAITPTLSTDACLERTRSVDPLGRLTTR